MRRRGSMAAGWIHFVVIMVVVVHGAVCLASSSSSTLDNGIFEWVRQKGGIYHEGQEFRRDEIRRDDGTTFSIAGVFATQDIPTGTVLAKIPWNVILSSDDLEESGQLCCGLVNRLKRELARPPYKDGGGRSTSFYAPYIDYVRQLPLTSIPSMWSALGKQLVAEMTGTTSSSSSSLSSSARDVLPPEDPVKWLEEEWFPQCGGTWDDKLGVQAAVIVLTRSDDHILIPGYDMYNHRNGNWTNAKTISEEGIYHLTTAAKDIRKGDQIYISYNQCEGCDNRQHEYGTAEIFRDYGFIEPLPQRFYYTDESRFMAQFDVVETDDGTLKVIWDSRFGVPKEKYTYGIFTGYLRRQIRRLRRLANISYRNGNPGMPDHEWEMAWEFQRVNLRAMTLALESMGETVDIPSNSTSVDHGPHYDPLGPERDDLSYSEETCDNEDELQHIDHLQVDFRETRYQDLAFLIEPTTRDVVMELDAVTQIASVYRPQYHEYAVHAAARFIDSVKRVIFIGGGDSMLLHEILKYPDLELVVGLELDQMVTRKAFRYFSTQPHFDDPRVEWWFGDATKSLLLLPKDYWQSFDLVLVDLSETVMSFGVTSQLDVFDALALLLKPEGVFVKNEIYMEPISKIFDHTVQICYVSPVICDQVFTFGSNKVDFFHSPVKDHGISTLLYEPMITSENRHNFLHDYSRNDARAQGKCEPAKSRKDERTKSAGIMEVVEAEQVTIVLDETAVSRLEEAVIAEGFHLNRKTAYDKNISMISLQEGYIMARFFSEEQYCNLDINLWGRFDRLKSLSAALTSALGSSVVSNYRVVVGGMFGATTWEYDKDVIGPQIVQTRDCSITTPPESAFDETVMIKVALEETLSSLALGESASVLVVCGLEGVDCLAHDVLKNSRMVAETARLSTCANLDDAADSATFYECELSLRTEWNELVLKSKKVSLVAFDLTAPKEMLQIINSILYDDAFRGSAFAKPHAVMAWSVQPDQERWRHEFLDRYRKQHMMDPVSHAAYEVLSGSTTLEFGIVSTGQKDIAFRLDRAEKSIQNNLPKASVTLKMIHGGKYAYWDPWEPKRFFQSDYDDNPGLSQYYQQKPLAVHSVAQFERVKGSNYKPTQKDIKEALEHGLETIELTCTTKMEVDDVGDGYVSACLNPQFGSIVMVWDGRVHIDISYYTIEEGKIVPQDMELFYMTFREQLDLELDVSIRDDMPRGTGRVVNFQGDMRTPEQREDMFEQLLMRAKKKGTKKKHRKETYERPLEAVPKVPEGFCSNANADQSSCWPDLPPLNA